MHFNLYLLTSSLLLLICFLLLQKKKRFIRGEKASLLSPQHNTTTLKEGMSETHFLLHAGSLQLRLSDEDYHNQDSLIIYTLGLLFNNDISQASENDKKIIATKIQLLWFADTYAYKLQHDDALHLLIEVYLQAISLVPAKLKQSFQLSYTEKEAEEILSRQLAQLLACS